jgi:hypothetical protein
MQRQAEDMSEKESTIFFCVHSRTRPGPKVNAAFTLGLEEAEDAECSGRLSRLSLPPS